MLYDICQYQLLLAKKYYQTDSISGSRPKRFKTPKDSWSDDPPEKNSKSKRKARKETHTKFEVEICFNIFFLLIKNHASKYTVIYRAIVTLHVN